MLQYLRVVATITGLGQRGEMGQPIVRFPAYCFVHFVAEDAGGRNFVY